MSIQEQIQIVEDNLNEYGQSNITLEEFIYLKDEIYADGCLAGMELGRADGARDFAEWLSDTEYVASQGHFILPLRGCFTIDDVVSEWSKEQK